MTPKKYLPATLLLFFTLTMYGQKDVFKKANALYKDRQYESAIRHFESGLEKTENYNARRKLAKCYAKTNKFNKAEMNYRHIIEDDRVTSRTILDFSKILISNGKNEEAAKWLDKYLELKPEDESTTLLRQSLESHSSIKSYFEDLKLVPFEYNTAGDDSDAEIVNGDIIFSSDRQQEINLFQKKSGSTGRNNYKMYISERSDSSSYEKPRSFSSKLNTLRGNSCNPGFARDGSKVVFTKNDHQYNNKGVYAIQLYESEQSGERGWTKPQKVNFCSGSFNYLHPCYSSGGDTMFFVSDKAGSIGGLDVFMAVRAKEKWKKPVNLGPAINSTGHEGFPFYHKSGRLFFCSKGRGGMGSFDLFVSEIDEEGKWTPAVNLGPPINSPADDVAIFIDPDFKSGILTTSRYGNNDDLVFIYFNSVLAAHQSPE